MQKYSEQISESRCRKGVLKFKNLLIKKYFLITILKSIMSDSHKIYFNYLLVLKTAQLQHLIYLYYFCNYDDSINNKIQ